MITVIIENFKVFSQKSYNKFLDRINIHELPCSCDIKGQLVKHGYYERKIKISGQINTIKILRAKCESCGMTHAVFPKEIVPYSQIPLQDQIVIIQTYLLNESFETIMITNEFIEENNIKYIINNYRTYWKERLKSYRISIFDKVKSLISKCLNTFKRQFMQIKCTPNILFLQNHIS